MSDQPLPKRIEAVRLLAVKNNWRVAVQHSTTGTEAVAMTFGRTVDDVTWRGWALWLLPEGTVKFKAAVSMRVPPGPLDTLTRLKQWLVDPASIESRSPVTA